MGFDETDGVDDEVSGKGLLLSSSTSVSCSICLEVVADKGERSWAKLQCGHQFHLDCIGSAFNVKGVMQCPNCRKIEKGQWLYATGCRSFPEFSFEDWTHDEDLYDLPYTEWPIGTLQWCPFGAFSRLPSSFDDPEFQSSAYHELMGQSTIFAEHTAVSSAAHSCPYIAYYAPFHSSSSSSSGGSVADSASFSNHWNGPPGSSEMPTSYGFPAVDPHYPNWEHHPSYSTMGSRIGNAEQASVQSTRRSNTDMPMSGPFIHPSLVSHSSGSRAGSSVTSSMVPPYPGSAARAQGRVQALQAYFQQPSSSPPMRVPGSRRSSSHRGMTLAGNAPQPPDQTGGFFIFPPASSNRNFQEVESPMPNLFHGWERENFTFPVGQIERDSSGGGFHQHSIGSSGFRHRHGSDRPPSQS
ncbi:E3 ubiquitin-protein ligase RFI2-like protein [Drosera capensis]